MLQFRLPDVGEGLTEAEVVTWLVAVGDTVSIDDPLCEIETAKSIVELPSPHAGTVTALLAEVGQVLPVGSPLVEFASAAAGGETTDDDGQATAPSAPGQAEGSVGVAPVPAAEGEPSLRGPAAALVAASDAPRAGSGSVLVGYGTAGLAERRRPRRGGPSGPVQLTPYGPHAEQRGPSTRRATPPVRRLAAELGIALAEVPSSDEQGVIRRADVLAYAAEHDAKALLHDVAKRDALYGAGAIGAPGAAGTPGLSLAHDVTLAKVDGGLDASWLTGGVTAPDGRSTRVPASSVRRATARAMVESAFTAPHVTVFHTVDVTRTLELVDALKADREFAGIKVTPLLIVMKALLLAIRRHPEINATWDEERREIIYHHHVALGVAASTPRGLLVPNIKDAERKSLAQLGRELGELIAQARAGTTPVAAMRGGTVTISNFGVFGIDAGTPILNPGEAAILGFGAISQRPWVVDGQLAVRWVTQLSLSFDHRLVDGELGSRVLADIARVMSDPAQALVWG
ncbi:dihydrolipoamide acetyltransferase family protein [Buchananella hordeovulneris]|uniref:Dihydrolipoamide acetyltransferase component of pyruvate dehydrogenase complex n=1 Tax=Buchananella hordeovulneris TaxID=52770 RepID=A0A1Q5PUN0_9ACTO|nr:dihydrolipoamide acetyltransferase family protein [Buchananella hordeovulneris]OKL51120.1 hypothetical protein BSZ40_09450 [Buchananella hordeovulneris]